MKELSDYVSKQNLFGYATSELSQDAFICWLLSYAIEGGASKDAALHGCAVEFLRKVLPDDDCMWSMPYGGSISIWMCWSR